MQGKTLLLNTTDLTAYRISKGALVSQNDANVKTMKFDTFEKAVRLSRSSLIKAGMALMCLSPSIVFVRLREGKGYAWASRVHVQHSGEYSVITDVQLLGEDILLLWPVPMAINWFLICKERVRLETNIACSMIVEYPPNMDRVQFFQSDFEVDGKVDACDLTVAQRIFIASLVPDLPPFATRQLSDDWCERMCDVDKRNFANHLLDERGITRNARDVHATVRGPPRTPFERKHRRLHRSRVVLDLPDELVGRIVCHLLVEVLSNVEAAVSVVAQLCAVSRQFRECTQGAVHHMVTRVHRVAHTLLGPTPSNPAHVQSVLWESGITLRHALATPIDNWCTYVRLRRALAQQQGDVRTGDQMHAFQRRALLWD